MRYQFKTKPYAHQVAALRKMRELEFNGALLMEPRTGKTKVAIDSAAILHEMGRAERVLVVAPVSVMGVWEDEIEAHCPVPYRIIVWDKDGRKYQNLPARTNKLTFVIINYDAFSTPGRANKWDADGKVVGRSKSRGGRFEMKREFLRWRPHLIILDESHRIKSPRARKTTTLQTIGGVADHKLILTGTVVTKKKRIFDIYSQWKFLNPESPLIHNDDGEPMTLAEFKQEYGKWTERNGYPQWLRNRNTEKLKRLLHAESFAVTRDECFDLPPRRDQIIRVQLTGHNAELYDEMAEEMIAKLMNGEITEASIKLVQSLRLAQLTSGITKTTPSEQYPEGRLVRVGKDKLKVFEELAEDYWEADEHIVVGARWRADIAAIAAIGKKRKVPTYQLHGGIPAADRQRAIKAFNGASGAALFVMQPQAGSLGIDLRSASIYIWFSLTNSWVDYTQSEDRIALSERSKMYMYLLAGGIDDTMYETLAEDGNLAKHVTRSPEHLLRGFKAQKR